MKVFKSIKWRLQLWYGLILVAVLAGFGFTAYQLEAGAMSAALMMKCMRRVGVLANAMRPPPRGPGANEFPPRGPGRASNPLIVRHADSFPTTACPDKTRRRRWNFICRRKPPVCLIPTI